MARHRSRIRLAGLILTGTLATAGPTRALDIRCQQGPLVRVVEVRFARDADGLPCEVIWRGRIGSDPRQLVWRSDLRLDFCTDKVHALAHQLMDEGWECESDMATYASRSVPAPMARLEPNEPEADAALPLGAAPDPAPMARLEPNEPEADAALPLGARAGSRRTQGASGTPRAGGTASRSSASGGCCGARPRAAR